MGAAKPSSSFILSDVRGELATEDKSKAPIISRWPRRVRECSRKYVWSFLNLASRLR